MRTLEFTAAAADAGQRLDRWLAAQAGELSRSALQALIEQGQVLRNGAPANKKDKLAAGLQHRPRRNFHFCGARHCQGQGHQGRGF